MNRCKPGEHSWMPQTLLLTAAVIRELQHGYDWTRFRFCQRCRVTQVRL